MTPGFHDWPAQIKPIAAIVGTAHLVADDMRKAGFCGFRSNTRSGIAVLCRLAAPFAKCTAEAVHRNRFIDGLGQIPQVTSANSLSRRIGKYEVSRLCFSGEARQCDRLFFQAAGFCSYGRYSLTMA